jgi:hypothetical protein
MAASHDVLNAVAYSVINSGYASWKKKALFWSRQFATVSSLVQEYDYMLLMGEDGADSWLTFSATVDAAGTFKTESYTYAKTNMDSTEEKYIWIDASETHHSSIVLTFNDPGTAIPRNGDHFWTLYRAESRDPAAIENIRVNTVSTVTFNVSQSGWYGIRGKVIDGSSLPTSVSIEINGESDVIAHHPQQSVHDMRTNIYDVRINGTSLLYSPNSTDWAKGGNIVMKQFSGTDIIENYMMPQAAALTGDTVVSTLMNMPNAVSMDWSTGGYGFIKPTDEEFFALRPIFQRNVAGNICNAFSPLIPPGGSLLFAIQAAPNNSGAGSDYPGGAARTYTCQSIEFTSMNNQLLQSQPPVGNPLDYSVALSQLRTLPQFHENPFHFSDIAKWFKRTGLPLLRKLTPAASAVTAALAPELSPLVSVVGDLIHTL